MNGIVYNQHNQSNPASRKAGLSNMAQAQKRGLLDDNNRTNQATIDELLDRSIPVGFNAAPEGPTSFTGLIPPSAADIDNKGHQPKRLKTFADIATAKNRPQTNTTNIIPLSQTDWLPPVLGRHNSTANNNSGNFSQGAAAALLNRTTSSTNDGFGSGPLSHAAAADLEFATSLPPTDIPPMDWALKSSIRFSSHVPFTLWQEAKMAPRSDFIRAQRAFADRSGDAALSLEQQLLAACMTWQFPNDTTNNNGAASVLDASNGNLTRTMSLSAAAKQARWNQWMSAFCSIYEQFRCGMCDAFYVVFQSNGKGGSTARRPPVAFFGAAGVAGRKRLHGVLTRSTPGVRGVLQQLGVGYATPLLSGGGYNSNENNDGGVKKGGRAPVGSSLDSALGGIRGMLFFEGALRVHGLFDLILNRAKDLQDESSDVPLILSPVHFMHSTIKSYQLEARGSSKPRDGSAPVHQLSLSGPDIPGWVSDRVLSVLCVSQNANLTANFEPHAESATLNWFNNGKDPDSTVGIEEEERGDDEAAAIDNWTARESGCIDGDEARRWRKGVVGLGCRAVTELKVEQGPLFTVRKMSNKVK